MENIKPTELIPFREYMDLIPDPEFGDSPDKDKIIFIAMKENEIVILINPSLHKDEKINFLKNKDFYKIDWDKEYDNYPDLYEDLVYYDYNKEGNYYKTVMGYKVYLSDTKETIIKRIKTSVENRKTINYNMISETDFLKERIWALEHIVDDLIKFLSSS